MLNAPVTVASVGSDRLVSAAPAQVNPFRLPTVVSAGNDKVVSKGLPSTSIPPATLATTPALTLLRLGNERLGSAVLLIMSKAPVTDVSAGNDRVVSNGLFWMVRLPPTVTRSEKSSVASLALLAIETLPVTANN